MITSANPGLTGVHPGITGDASLVYGDVSGIIGDVSRFVGDATGVKLDLNRIEIVGYLKIIEFLESREALYEDSYFDIMGFYWALRSGNIQKHTRKLLDLKERLCAGAGC